MEIFSTPISCHLIISRLNLNQKDTKYFPDISKHLFTQSSRRQILTETPFEKIKTAFYEILSPFQFSGTAFGKTFFSSKKKKTCVE